MSNQRGVFGQVMLAIIPEKKALDIGRKFLYSEG